MPPSQTLATAPAIAKLPAHLIGLAPVLEVVNVALFTPFITEATPISIMLVAPSGAGKTQTLKRFAASFIHKTNDLTSSGLWNILKEDRDEKVTHICLEDFNPVLSHKASVSNLLIANLLSVMADGMMRIDDGREAKELKHKPIGVITGVTPEMFQSNLEKWQQLGLVRRFLPIHYCYTQRTISAAQKSVKTGDVTSKALPAINLPAPKEKVSPKIPTEVANEIEVLSVYLGQHLGIASILTKGNNNEWKRNFVQGNPVLPMAPHIVLRTMAQARALMNRRGSCNESDVQFIRDLVQFCNATSPRQL